MISRLLPFLAVTLALGACNARTPTAATASPRYASLDSALAARADTTASLSSAIQRERRATPVAVLPAWIGRPTRLDERDDSGIFEQAISLSLTPRGEPRENLIMVTVPRSITATDGSASGMGKPTQAGIRAELDAVFPGIAMQVVERPAANSYGPYGLAIGRGAAGARCLYAWQWIEEPPVLQAGQSGSTPLSLRVRLCRSDITLEAMAAAVNQLRLVPRFGGQPVALPRVASIGAVSADSRKSRRHHAANHRVASEPAPRAETRAYGTSSPIPSTPDMSGRRYLGADSAAVATPAPSSLPDAIGVGTGPIRSTLARLGSPVPADAAGAISADLPPEAYRGPSANQTR